MSRNQPYIYLGEIPGKWRKGPVYGSQTTSPVYSSKRTSKMAKKSEIEINNYFPDSKFRVATYSGLTINEIDYSGLNKSLQPKRKMNLITDGTAEAL
jgi:hypothetical protein